MFYFFPLFVAAQNIKCNNQRNERFLHFIVYYYNPSLKLEMENLRIFHQKTSPVLRHTLQNVRAKMLDQASLEKSDLLSC